MTGKGRGLVGRKLKKVEDRQSRGSLHKIGVIGGGGGEEPSANYGILRARLGLVGSLKSKRKSN